MIELNQQEWNTLTAILAHMKSHGEPPSYKRIARRMSLTCESTARKRVGRLIALGIVRYGRWRREGTQTLESTTVMIRYEEPT